MAILGQYIWPNPQPIPTSYADEINTLKTWIQKRSGWLDINIPNEGARTTINAGSGIKIKIAPNSINESGELLLISDSHQQINLVICNSIGQTLYAVNIMANAGINHLKRIPFCNW